MSTRTKPAKAFAARMREMSDDEARAYAQDVAQAYGLTAPQGKSGKTALRIVAREARLRVRTYSAHRAVLMDQLGREWK